jgi:CDP-paratose 2-epimerase
MRRALITGSSGLVGSECVRFLCENNFKVFGVDRGLRHLFAGAEGSTAAERLKLDAEFAGFLPIEIDIRDQSALAHVFRYHGPFDLIIHAAGQPVHDWATEHTVEDFHINAVGTVNMLECCRRMSPGAVFIQLSTSKVYGSHLAALPLVEQETRYDLPAGHPLYAGITEAMGIDQCTRSMFGASKAAADIVAQEYGRYLGLKVAVFRPVTIAGPAHRGTAAHGYLSHLVNSLLSGTEYVINGFKGKQVRDNIHVSDLVAACWQVYLDPAHTYGEVYNIGAGRESCNSILEAISFVEDLTGTTGRVRYQEQTRQADWRWCIFDTGRFRGRYPGWAPSYDNERLLKDMCATWTPQGDRHE